MNHPTYYKTGFEVTEWQVIKENNVYSSHTNLFNFVGPDDL